MSTTDLLRKQAHRGKKKVAARSPKDLEALDLIEQRYRPQDSLRARLERRWTYNLSFTLGNQWNYWDQSQWSLKPIKKSERWLVRETRNFIRPHVERSVASNTAFHPKWRPIPNSGELEDEQATRVATNVLDHYYRTLRMGLRRQEAQLWAEVTGTGFLKVFWDPDLGKDIPQIYVGEDDVPEMEMLAEGDIDCYAPSPFTIFVDPGATSDEDVEWMMEVTVRSRMWASRQWPKEASSFQDSTQHSDSSLRRQQATLDISGYGLYGALGDTLDADSDRVLMREYYQKRSAAYPDGRLIVVVGDTVVFNGDNPIGWKRYPFPYVAIRKMLVPGSYWGQSEVDNMLSPQRNYNRIHSTKLQHLYQLGMFAKVLWPDSAGEPDSHFVPRVGEILKYTPGLGEPKYLAPPALPAESDREAMSITSDLEEITNTHGAEKGRYQGKLSGAAINLMVEAGQANKQPVAERAKDFLERWGKLVLTLFQDYADEERTIRVAGPSGAWDVQAFQGADLADNTDVVIEVDSVQPKSRWLTIQEVQAMAGVGFLNPANPEDRNLVHRMLKYESGDVALQEREVHRQYAQMEHALAKEGAPVPDPQPWQDRDIHVATHKAWMNSAEFQMLPPESQALMYEHWQKEMELAMPQTGVTVPPEMEAQADPNAQAGPPG